MLFNSIRLGLRNALKNASFTFINILGLSIGLATCLLIFLFVENEYSFDAFHSKRDSLYRLNEVQSWEGIIPQNVALSMYPMGPTLTQDYPQINSFARIINRSDVPLRTKDKKLFVDQLYLTDTSFFDLFDFPLLYGDPHEALNAPNSLVLSETVANQFFGKTDVLGENLGLYGNDTTFFKVTGILEDVPENSHLQFDGLISLPTFPESDSAWMNQWGSNWLVTYLKLQPGTDIPALESKFPDYLTKYLGEDATDGYQLYLQPLSEIHLGSSDITHDYRNYQKFNGKYVSMFSFLALFVLLIAGINFMNLTTARSSKRAQEIGVRKTIGATRGALARGFLAESILYTFTALIVALVLTSLVLPYLNEFSQRDLSFLTLLRAPYAFSILLVCLLVGVLAGLYPALFMSRFDPVKALKGNLFFKHRKISLQNVLVVTQFTLAIALVIGTLLVTRQLYFMLNQDPGFNREQVMLVPANREVNEGYEPFKQALSRYPAVKGVSASGQRLGSNIHQTGVRYRMDTAVQSLAISSLNVDYNYLDFYEIELLKGRGFSKEYASDSAFAFVINETLAQKIGWEDPIGKPFKFGWEEEWGTIIGVCKDFNYNSYHHDINPLAMYVRPEWGYSEVSVKISPKDLTATLPDLENHWRETGTDRDLEYEFLDTHFDTLYRADSQVSQLVGIVAALAILVACLGLFGLISITAERKTKEIGIRKVLGASVAQLMGLFTKEVAVLVLIAFFLAIGPTWWIMKGWLENFAYRIDMQAWTFALAGLVALLVALLTISFRAFRSANSNPVECLRYE